MHKYNIIHFIQITEDDYVPITEDIVFTEGLPGCTFVRIEIIDDAILELIESFSATITTNNSRGVTVNPSRAEVSISGNEGNFLGHFFTS